MSLKTKILTFSTFVILAFPLKSSKLEKAFDALRIYDYFLAKKTFIEINQKSKDAYASYGLAIIFSRNDNPFSNSDSAGKYIRLSYYCYNANPKPLTLSGFVIDDKTIALLMDSISLRALKKARLLNTIDAYESFLKNYSMAGKKRIQEAVYLRDDLEFNKILELNKSDSTAYYMLLHPLSSFYQEAFVLLERQIYDEQTLDKTPEAYMVFLKKYPKSLMVKTAHEKLFAIYRQKNDKKGLADFVNNYPDAHQSLEAWKLLFSLSVKEFSFAELEKFVAEYPAFPLKTSILNELELNKLILYPYHQGDFAGFIDNKGKLNIRPMYDAVTDFFEGLSVVSKNDSVYFVNKKNINPFDKIYSDASVFKNGIAPVKQNNKWFFINRQGQVVSRSYDEINELSDQVYVVKLGDKYGAIDHFGQAILDPKFDKLGDFKNNFAYYMEKGVYGFVSRLGNINKAEFEWISDFNPDGIAVIKQNNKYGLVNSFGKKILEPEFDQVLKTNSSFFIVILNNLYGFFSSSGCFITPISYDFVREKSPEFFTSGVLFKLIKKGEQAFVDENGRMYINYGAYQEINFASNDLIRVKQKNKYGYADKKLNMVIQYKYQQAEDFLDSLALVKYKDINIIIDTYGMEVFSTGAEIVKISKHYFIVNDDARSVINNKGDLIYTEVDNVQKINQDLLIITLNNGEIKLIYD